MIEASYAAEAAGKSNLRERKRRVSQQSFCEQQTLCLSERNRCDTKLALKYAPQVAIRDAELGCNRVDAHTVELLVFDKVRGCLCSTLHGIDTGIARRELGTAT